MTNAARYTAPADIIDTLASLAEDSDLAHALCAVDGLLDASPACEGPAECVGNLLAALAYLLRATASSRSRASLTECAAVYERVTSVLLAWRLDCGAESWAGADWASAEVVACAECDDRRHTLRAALLDAAAGVDGAVYRRICRAA